MTAPRARGFAAVRATVAEHGYALVRAHARRNRLQLELGDGVGQRVIGQWLLEAETAAEVATATEAVAPGRVRRLGHHLVLQAGGADRRLPALAALVDQGAEIVVHRPERRAVVRTCPPPAEAGAVYTKVVRPRRTAGLVRRMERAALPGLQVPRVTAADEAAGTVTMSTLPGRPLHDLLTGHVPAEAATAVGRMVATLHAVPETDGVPRHDLSAEVDTTLDLLDLVRIHGALHPRAVDALVGDVRRAAATVEGVGPVGPPSLLHRDLHDKQLLVDEDNGVGMLDIDTLGVGDPALDLGNLLAHLDLRVRQGWTTTATAKGVEEAVLAGYRPDARTRAASVGYRALTRARLRALYAFRPGDGPVERT